MEDAQRESKVGKVFFWGGRVWAEGGVEGQIGVLYKFFWNAPVEKVHTLGRNAVGGNVAALFVVRANLGEPSARSVSTRLLYTQWRKAKRTL